MLDRGDLNHVYYEYPGLFFYLLVPVLAPLHAMDLGRAPTSPPARWCGVSTLTCCCSTSSGDVCAADRRLVAALLLAVSPLDVTSATWFGPTSCSDRLARFVRRLRVRWPERRAALAAGACLARPRLSVTGVLLHRPSSPSVSHAARPARPSRARYDRGPCRVLPVHARRVWRAQAFFSASATRSLTTTSRRASRTPTRQRLYYARAPRGTRAARAGLFVIVSFPLPAWRRGALLLHPWLSSPSCPQPTIISTGISSALAPSASSRRSV